MSEDAKPATPDANNTETVHSLHLVEGLSQQLSTDGKMAMLIFLLPNGQKFGITMDLKFIAVLRGMVHKVGKLAEAVQQGAKAVTFAVPRELNVGFAPDFPNHTAIMFNPGAEDESCFMIQDATAMQMAAHVTQQVLSRMTPAQRAQAIAAERNKIIPAGRPGLILPG